MYCQTWKKIGALESVQSTTPTPPLFSVHTNDKGGLSRLRPAAPTHQEAGASPGQFLM